VVKWNIDIIVYSTIHHLLYFLPVTAYGQITAYGENSRRPSVNQPFVNFHSLFLIVFLPPFVFISYYHFCFLRAAVGNFYPMQWRKSVIHYNNWNGVNFYIMTSKFLIWFHTHDISGLVQNGYTTPYFSDCGNCSCSCSHMGILVLLPQYS
jgi:hypothetical protein